MFPSHPLFRRFENELVVGEQKLEWTMRERDFCFRPLNGDERIIWCELERGDMPSAFDQPERLRRVQARLADNLAQKKVWRFWPLDEERELVLDARRVLMRHKEANFWLRLDWRSPIDDEDMLLFLPDLTPIEANIELNDELWEESESIRREGQLRWFVCSRGDINELARVLNAYFALSGHYFHYFAKGNLNFGSLLHAPYDAIGEHWLQLRRICELLDRYFTLRWNPLVRSFYNREGRPARRTHVYIRRPVALSQHERLEALLVWREFLRDKLPLEEIKALLPKR